MIEVSDIYLLPLNYRIKKPEKGEEDEETKLSA